METYLKLRHKKALRWARGGDMMCLSLSSYGSVILSWVGTD